jgi:Arc/MetJ family transcription regulator
MRTTLNINDHLLKEAMKFTGIKEKTALVHAGLEALVSREAGRRLAAMGGTQKDISVPPRRRPNFQPLKSLSKRP